jgi:tetratricopeptide (TPR) repeat protein
LQAIEADPRHGEARRWAALSYAERGDIANEYRMARAAHDAEPEDSHYLFLLMTIVIHKLGDYRAGLDVIQTMYADRPPNFQAHMWLGHIYGSLREHARSLDHYRAAAKLRPDSATAPEGVGQALSALGRFDEAAQALQRAVDIAPSWPRLHTQLSDVYRRQRRYAEATRELERGIQLGGATADQQMRLCFLYLRTGAVGRAIACYEAIIAAHPDHVGARRALSFIRPGVKAATAP